MGFRLTALGRTVGGGANAVAEVDGGIRRGTDAFKALALGADAVGFGRPYLWGLAAFGAAGVTKTVEVLTAELRRTMLQAGAASVAEITEQKLRENP